MINYLMDYSYALNEDFKKVGIMSECGPTPPQVKILETGLNVLSKDCLGRNQYLDIKVKCIDNNKIFYTQSRFLKYKLKEKTMKSVKQMMKDGELKEGMKLKLKPLSECDEDKFPGITSTMKEFFGKKVTVDELTKVNGWIRIKEYSLFWHSDWFEDIGVKEYPIKVGSRIKRITDDVENVKKEEIYTLKFYLDTNCYDGTPWITLEEVKGEYCIMGFELVEEDTFKVALEKSILMWQEMYNKDCSKEQSIEDLFPGEEPVWECFLCECLRGGGDNSVKECKKCLKWSEDTYFNGIAFCNNSDSPFRIWNNYRTKKNTLDVLNFLKHEYIRLYGEKEFQERNKKLYDFLKKEEVLKIYWDNVINSNADLIGFIKEIDQEMIISSFDWDSSKEGLDFWNELQDKWESKDDEEIKKDYYHFKDIEINFNQLCNDALEDDTPSFIVVGKDKAFAGLIQSGKKVGVPMVYEDFMKSGNIINFVPELPYGIFEISLDKVEVWKEKLKQYSKDFKSWREDLNNEIKDRDRKDNIKRKDLKSFKVYQF